MHARAWPLYPSLSWICPLLLGLWLGSAGCGSTLYVNQVTRKASASVAAAEAVNAAEYAPYWYTLAVEYLHKAREEAAHADFEAANRFGRRSEAAAERARTLAVQRAANPRDKSWRPPPGVPGSAADGDAGDGAEDSAGDDAGDEAADESSGEAGDGADDNAGEEAGGGAGDDAGEQVNDQAGAAQAQPAGADAPNDQSGGQPEGQSDDSAEDKQ